MATIEERFKALEKKMAAKREADTLKKTIAESKAKLKKLREKK